MEATGHLLIMNQLPFLLIKKPQIPRTVPFEDEALKQCAANLRSMGDSGTFASTEIDYGSDSYKGSGGLFSCRRHLLLLFSDTVTKTAENYVCFVLVRSGPYEKYPGVKPSLQLKRTLMTREEIDAILPPNAAHDDGDYDVDEDLSSDMELVSNAVRAPSVLMFSQTPN
ncbi:hypothetical protein L1987_45168 [Smallanthus sonchifolius]|uniref:Uncharacterized protein n=1 Tax=Smallanthus sonchifolius TaxID=185202 RepID=A0ACB9GSP3_9ASTR|nr:hypothetical protein L1987_45168 [Smallanthus sonchifolius]